MRSQLLTLHFLLTRPLAYAPGHFYSPVVDPKELKGRYHDPALKVPESVAGIDLNREAQVALWDQWRLFFGSVADASNRFSPSRSYSIGDATIYACMLRHLTPLRVIEVGSGSSSALVLDIADRFLQQRPRFTFI